MPPPLSCGTEKQEKQVGSAGGTVWAVVTGKRELMGRRASS